MKTLPIENLNVWINCKIQVINEETWKYQTVCECLWTPKEIKKAMKKHKLNAAWIFVMGDRTYQFASDLK